jgi:serpin B
MAHTAFAVPQVLATLETLEPRCLLSDVAGGLGPPAPGVAADLPTVVAENNAFAFDLYQQLRGGSGSLFFSPLSISAALAMTYAGAAGATASQMADVFHWALPGDRLHPAFGELIAQLLGQSAGASAAPGDQASKFIFDIANSLWGQSNYQFYDDFLDTLAESYHAPLVRHDFRGSEASAEAGRVLINDWVSDKTHDRIKDLLKPDDITEWTRLVLVNAIYMKAAWQYQFEEAATRPQTFHLPGEDLTVEMMHQTHRYKYAEGEGYQVLELPYAGTSMSMDIFLPRAGAFDAFEQGLSAETTGAILDKLRTCQVSLSLPKFKVEQEMELSEVLKALGMPDAFDPDAADFSGIHDSSVDGEGLVISKVRHKAWIEVKEDGAEAAAATAVVMKATSCVSAPPPPVPFTADRPFIYMIRDTATGSMLFMGRVSAASSLSATDGAPIDEPVEPSPLPPGISPVVPLPPLPDSPPFMPGPPVELLPLPDGPPFMPGPPVELLPLPDVLPFMPRPPADVPPLKIIDTPKITVTVDAAPHGVLLTAVRGPAARQWPAAVEMRDIEEPLSALDLPQAPATPAGAAWRGIGAATRPPVQLRGGASLPVAFAFGAGGVHHHPAATWNPGAATLDPLDLAQVQALFAIRV